MTIISAEAALGAAPSRKHCTPSPRTASIPSSGSVAGAPQQVGDRVVVEELRPRRGAEAQHRLDELGSLLCGEECQRLRHAPPVWPLTAARIPRYGARLASKRSVLITGATAGLGLECARAIAAEREWHVILSGRDPSRLSSVAEALERSTGDGKVESLTCDLASLQSVRDAVGALRAGEHPPLGAVVCNAGVQIVGGMTRTIDGYETTFAVNHLAHFLLVNLLLDDLVPPARIVFVASGVHNPANRTAMPPPLPVDARALATGEGPDEPASVAGRRRYTTSKLCNVMCAYELDRRLRAQGGEGGEGFAVNAFDPGLMPGTGLARDYSPFQRFVWRFVFPALRVMPGVNSTAKSGRALARLVTDPGLEGVSGRYFEGTREVASSQDSYNEIKAAELWAASAELVGLADAAGSATRRQ